MDHIGVAWFLPREAAQIGRKVAKASLRREALYTGSWYPFLESTLANRFASYWFITIMLVAEGLRLLKNQWFSGWLANPYPSYRPVWSGEPNNKNTG